MDGVARRPKKKASDALTGDVTDDGQTDRERIDALILLCLAALMVIANRYDSGEVPASALPSLLLPVLAEYHAQAGVIGYRAAVDAAPTEDDALTFGQSQADEDAPYLDNFAKQLEAGWGRKPAEGQNAPETTPGAITGASAGVLSLSVVENRLSLYAARLYATAHEAFVLASPAKSTFTWHLDDGIYTHCPDCPRLAEGGPYTADTLPNFPGDGSQQCKTRCRCWLERNDGKQPFKG